MQVLRGVAVLAVVAFHCGVLPGGFVGVDVFFVISGFVIGSVLVEQLGTEGRVDVGGFLRRRAHRLLPALAVMLCVVVLLAPFLGPIGAAEVTPRTAVAATFISANAYLFRVAPDGYFDAAAELNPLLHTWSLSVEEQIFLLVPLSGALAWVLARRRLRPIDRWRLVALVVGVASFVASVVLVGSEGPGSTTDQRLAFFSPFTRVWEFTAGLALVLVPWSLPRRRLPWIAAVVAGSALIAAPSVMYSATTPFPGLTAAVPVLGAALIILGGTCRPAPPAAPAPPGAPHRLVRPLERLGDVSYGWYLWHWPLIVFAAAAWPLAGTMPRIAAAAAALGPAWLSHRYVERSPWDAGAAPWRRSTALLACCIAAPLLVVAATRPLTDEVLHRASQEWFAQAHRAHTDEATGCSSDLPIGDRDPDTCVWGSPAGQREVVLIGDSNAGQFSEAMIGAVDATGDHLRIATAIACPFVDLRTETVRSGGSAETCQQFVDGSIEDLTADPPDVVVIANATDWYVGYDGTTLVDPVTGERARSTSEKAAAFEGGLERVVTQLSEAGIDVLVVNVVPKPWAAGVDLDSRGCSGLVLELAPRNCTMPTYRRDNPVTAASVELESRATARGGGTTWSFNDVLCPDGVCAEVQDGTVLWSESFHISVEASELLAGRAADMLEGRG